MGTVNNPMDPQSLFAFGDEEDYLPIPPWWQATPAAAQLLSDEEIRSAAADAVESPEFFVLSQESKLALTALYVLCVTSHSRTCEVGKLNYFCGIEDPRCFASVLAELESAGWISVDDRIIRPRAIGDQLMHTVSFSKEILPLARAMVAAHADLRLCKRFS